MKIKKELRKNFLDKIAAVYEDPEHPERIRERRELLSGPPEEVATEYTEEDTQKAIEEYLAKKRQQDSEAMRASRKDPRKAVTSEHAEEVPNPYDEVLRQKGIDPSREPLSDLERQRRQNVENEINMYSTIGEIEGPDGLSRHYVDPNNPKMSLLHKYFGYFDREKNEWHPTQFSYILYYMNVYAPEFGLEEYWDRTKEIHTPREHPYKNKYKLPEVIYPFKKEMEDRILKDFPNLMSALSKVVWKTNVNKREGLPYIAPPAPDSDRRFSDTVQFRFLEGDNSFTVKGPKSAIRIPSEYAGGESDMNRVTKQVLSKMEMYPKLSKAIEALRKDINDNLLRELLLRNRELNFRRRDEKEKEEIRGALIDAINEVITGEITKIIQESDF